MNKQTNYIYFIEKFTLLSGVVDIFPYFLKRKKSNMQVSDKMYFLDGSRAVVFIARIILKMMGVHLEHFNYRLVDVRDDNGDLIWFKVLFEDLAKVQTLIAENPAVENTIAENHLFLRIRAFLLKRAMCSGLFGSANLSRVIFFVRVVAWQARRENKSADRVFVFLKKHAWLTEITAFAAEKGVVVVPIKQPGFPVKKILLRFTVMKNFAKKGIYWKRMLKYLLRGQFPAGTRDVEESKPLLAVEYYGNFNLNRPELFSDLFFWQKSDFPARDLLVYFGLSQDPVDDSKWEEIKKAGMAAIAIDPLAVTTPCVPLFNSRTAKGGVSYRQSTGDSAVARWLQGSVGEYKQQYDFWVRLFTENNIKIHVSWYKFNEGHCVIADALKSVGGIGTIYQRSFEEAESPWSVVNTDVVFGYSRKGAHIEQETVSNIPYYIVTGHLGGHRSVLLQSRAREAREFVMKNGAQKIVAYFDENSRGDTRWCIGHSVMQESYEYLLNKVLEDPWFGLILKPKVPASLRHRLGGVADLLKAAEQTGRCFIFEEGNIHGAYPPVVASLAADIAIHGNLFAGSAGIESALAGTPTLLLDREGWSTNSLYNLGVGKVVFTDWNDLWHACINHWNGPQGIPGFGDWSHNLDMFDPFRDDRAAERMGTYLKWLLEGFKAGLPRETVLADAAERYANAWGEDKVINLSSPAVCV